MGCNRKSLLQNLEKHFIFYFIYSPQPSWMCNACQHGSGCPTRQFGAAQQGSTLPRTGEICPPTQGAWGWLGWGGSHKDRGQPTHAGHSALLLKGSQRISAHLGKEHGGLGRISKRREEMEEQRTGMQRAGRGWGLSGSTCHWPGLGTSAPGPGPCSSSHPLLL